jgi:hypothetical protein
MLSGDRGAGGNDAVQASIEEKAGYGVEVIIGEVGAILTSSGTSRLLAVPRASRTAGAPGNQRFPGRGATDR